ncbi:hypothetical protein K435DRAFT_870256 [Dendrothele bispora CBS 962.96]|uniref:Uncharacterized protein n=1 Tax=Dendrothele bispora (strain CBS 962.96) TaxID=1314807 RepID=A0A4S8L7P7_DENBC|nr:hypothetical protein K435DRAFT_870256 [Dendrothele bispora CBS 962.96]
MSRYNHPITGITPNPPPSDDTGGDRTFFTTHLDLDGCLVRQLRDTTEDVPSPEIALGLLSLTVDTHDELQHVSSEQLDIRSAVNGINSDIYSVVNRTQALLEEMWDISDPAKNYIRLLIWIDFLIPLEGWRNLTKDVLVLKTCSKLKDRAGTLSLYSYKSGKKLAVERVNEFVESAYNKIGAVVFKMVLDSTKEARPSVNTARKLQEALIARSGLDRVIADQEQNVVLITYAQMRSVLRELQKDGQLHSDEELQDQAFVIVGKYMDKAVQKFGTNLFSYDWRFLCSWHVADDALATF